MSLRSFLAFFAGLAACGLVSNGVAGEPLKTRLAQNLSPISGLVLVAKAEGFFDQHGLDVGVSNFTSDKQALDTVLGGGADIATTGISGKGCCHGNQGRRRNADLVACI
jgi:ABC-type nitrate/sulfonate/bicarbonate transport system substrate-binding protein